MNAIHVKAMEKDPQFIKQRRKTITKIFGKNKLQLTSHKLQANTFIYYSVSEKLN